MPELAISPRDCGTVRRIYAWQHPSHHPALHLFSPHESRHILHDIIRGTSQCRYYKIRQIDPLESEGARVKICTKCFKGQSGYAELGWVVTVVFTSQERLEV